MKTKKTASTAVELFLTRFCGDKDIVTSLGKDETQRQGSEPRNFLLTRRRRGNRLLRLCGEILGRPAVGYRGFYPHIPAKEIRRLAGEQIWREYFKFTIERNPWDRQVSLYHWHYRNKDIKPSFDLFIRSPLHRKRSPNFDIYAIGGQVATDYVCRYETLEEDLAYVLKQIGIDARVDLTRVKATHRSQRSWREYYTPRTRDIVGRWYAREIRVLGYTF